MSFGLVLVGVLPVFVFGVFFGWEGEVCCFVVADLNFLLFGLNCLQTG